MIRIYGIPNCDTVKKATAWLKSHKIPFEFHNYKTDGISKKKLNEWLKMQPLEILFNKRSTAWKELTAAEQKLADTTAGAVSLMEQYPNLVKRPVAEISGTILIGFKEEEYAKAFLRK